MKKAGLLIIFSFLILFLMHNSKSEDFNCIGNKACKIITPTVINASNPAQCYNQTDVCKIDVFYPNGSIFYKNGKMTNQVDCRYSNISNHYNITGNWNFNVYCQRGADAGAFTGKIIIDTIKPTNIGNISCQYNTQPFIKSQLPFSTREQINWLCTIGNSLGQSYKCNTYAYAYSENRPYLIQQNPEAKSLQGVGLIDYFKPEPENAKTQLLNAYFTNKDLRDNATITFSVLCQSNQFNKTISFIRNVTPTYKELSSIAESSFYARSNAGYILMLVFGIIIFGLLFIFVIRMSK